MLIRLQQQTARSDAGSLLVERGTSYSFRITFRLKRWFSALKVRGNQGETRETRDSHPIIS